MLSSKKPRQRLLAGLRDDAFPHPLPELRLRRPKLFPIATDDERRLFLLLFLFGLRHVNTRLPLRGYGAATQVPRREASLARQQQVVKTADEHTLPRPRNACEFDGYLTQLLREVSERNWLLLR